MSISLLWCHLNLLTFIKAIKINYVLTPNSIPMQNRITYLEIVPKIFE